MTDARLRSFRFRVLVAAGVALGHGPLIRAAHAGGTAGSSDSGSSGSSGSGSSGSDSESDSTTADGRATTDDGSTAGGTSDGTAGTSTAADGTSSGDGASASGASTSPAPSDTGSASSSSTGDFGETSGGLGADDWDCGGCYGRPYISEHVVRTAAPIASAAWLPAGPAPRIDELGAEAREALAVFWTRAALSEHSSVAGFHRFALDLLAHGAPAELVARAQRAAIEELEHAQACFGLASAYAGRAIGPGRMPLGASAPVASTLEQLAVWTVHEGCVGETVAAWLASEIHEHATDPAVAEVMTKIAQEEATHAELSWATLRWAMDAGGDRVRLAVTEAFRIARIAPPSEDSLACAAHGLLPSHAADAAMRRAFLQIVKPCARSVLAAA